MLWSCDEHDKSFHPLSDLDLNINTIHTHSIHTRYEHFSQAPFTPRIRSSGAWIRREHSVQLSFNQEAKDMLMKVHQHLQNLWSCIFILMLIKFDLLCFLPFGDIVWLTAGSVRFESSSFIEVDYSWDWTKYENCVHRTIASISWTTDMTQLQTYSTTCDRVMCFVHLCHHILFSGCRNCVFVKPGSVF